LANFWIDMQRQEGTMLLIVTHSPELAQRCERRYETTMAASSLHRIRHDHASHS
jgi:predicted ABC-type transport system involved in lysophospholipase L1 biosynthesis ATPase subunit